MGLISEQPTRLASRMTKEGEMEYDVKGGTKLVLEDVDGEGERRILEVGVE